MSDIPESIKKDFVESLEIVTFFDRYAEILIDKMIASNPGIDKESIKEKFLFNCEQTFNDYWKKVRG